MSITYHERPGVYVEYDTTSRSAAGAPRIVGIAAQGSGTGLYRFASAAAAAQTFPTTSDLGKMVQLAFEGGAAQVVCCPVNSSTAYADAVSLLLESGGAGAIALDCDNAQTLSAICAILCAEGARECVAFIGLDSPAVQGLCSFAGNLNCERMVLLGADVRMSGAQSLGGGFLAAAAMAGVFAAQQDPALPLSGAELPGLDAVSLSLSETEIDTLVRAGVTPLEAVGGLVRVIRAVTTRTMTDDVPDDTWRELSTVAIVDDVIPAVRDALRAKFLRRKNTAVTRNAIRSQAAIILDDRVRREIIEGYDSLTVEALESDPTTCEVRFGFRVVHGLERIHLSVHILV